MHPTKLSRRRFVVNGSLTLLGLRGSQLFSQAPVSLTAVPVMLRTPLGDLRGQAANGVRIFRGVPFAEPPMGSLRFRDPVKVRPWTGKRDATHFAAAAMQTAHPQKDSEDCLYLNIWAPEGKGPFPVYVWIHGGGFTGGSAFDPIFDGTELAREGIVCVTVAYRLGVFGFMDVEPLLGSSYAGTANNGLRDLLTALEWVQANIAAFSGDPSRVTIGGESAGAKLTALLMAAPSAEPLFSQMISESGGADRFWPEAQSAATSTGFGEQWRTQTGQPNSALQTSPASLLIEVQQSFLSQWPQHFPFRAEIDGRFLSQTPLDTIAEGSTRRKRLLIGTNRDESALFLGPHPATDPGAADLSTLSAAKFDEVYSRYKDVYPALSDEQKRIRAVSAEEYWVPSIRLADAHVKGGGSAWMYRLDFAESSGRLEGYAFHSLDLRLVWDKPSSQAENASMEKVLAMQMHQAWAAFVRGEAPAAAGLPPWPAYRSDTRPTMIFNTTSHVEQEPGEAELRLWKGVL